MSMIEKAELGNIPDLGGFETVCTGCGHENRIIRSVYQTYSQGGGDELYGGVCGGCSTRLWAVLRYNHILRLFDTPIKGVEMKLFLGNIQRQFLDSLPPCPVCQNQSYIEFVGTSVPDSAKKCSKCNLELPNYYRITERMLHETVYLFWESPGDRFIHKSTRRKG
jgi:hypothetical protein